MFTISNVGGHNESFSLFSSTIIVISMNNIARWPKKLLELLTLGRGKNTVRCAVNQSLSINPQF